MLGMRDDLYRQEIAVPTIADRVRLRPAADLHAAPENSGRQAAGLVASEAAGLAPAPGLTHIMRAQHATRRRVAGLTAGRR